MRTLTVMAVLVLAAFPHAARCEEEPGKQPQPAADGSVDAGGMLRRAEALVAKGDLKSAIGAYRAVAARLEGRVEAQAEYLAALHGLATCLQDSGQLPDAATVAKRAVEVARRVHPGDHPVLPRYMGNLASIHNLLGRPADALRIEQEALAMLRRLHPGDHLEVVSCLSNVAGTLHQLGRPESALPLDEEALAMRRRLLPGDHSEVATSLNNMAYTYVTLGRHRDALPLQEEALAMRLRLVPGDDPEVARCRSVLASTYGALGRQRDALRMEAKALATRRRLFPGGHPDLATSLANLAYIQDALGQHQEALGLGQEALTMRRRLFPGDHPLVALSLTNVAFTHRALGRLHEALSREEEALAMRRRLFPGDHHDVAHGLNNLAGTYEKLGRLQDALPLFEEALAMWRRLFPGDRSQVAFGLDNLAGTYVLLGRSEEALPLAEEALAMRQRLFSGDHPDVATSMGNLARVFGALGEPEDALPLEQGALAMRRRLCPGDHPRVALSLSNVAQVHGSLGRLRDALALQKEALAMRRRLFPGDHPEFAHSLLELASTHDLLGQPTQAVDNARAALRMGKRLSWAEVHRPAVLLAQLHMEAGRTEEAVAVLEPAVLHVEGRRRDAAVLGTAGRARYVSALRRSDPIAPLVEAYLRLDRIEDALGMLERGRGREMLDLLELSRLDPLERATARARESGDAALERRLQEAHTAIRSAEAAVIAAEHAKQGAEKTGRRPEIVSAGKADLQARRALQRALRERLQLLREALPEGRPLETSEIRDLLGDGELLVAYLLGAEASHVFVVSPESVDVYPLGSKEAPIARGEVADAVQIYVDALSYADSVADTGPHPGALLFEKLMPAPAWRQIGRARRIYLLPHGALHRLPFEALVVSAQNRPVYWAEVGPPIAYANSASVLAWLRQKPRGANQAARVVAVADPVFEGATKWPAKGVLITGVTPDSQAARIGLAPGDVIQTYGGVQTPTFAALVEAFRAASRDQETLTLRYEREGEVQDAVLAPGRMGVQLAQAPPTVAGPELGRRAPFHTAMRSTDRRGLSRLPHTRTEIEHLAEIVGNPLVSLVGAEATESALYAAARSPRILHLATHGLVSESKGALSSALALTPPRLRVPGNDGFLTLADLLERWRGRLQGTELVVLSACESQTGTLESNEGMFALPWGFCFAGARSAIASLWKVDDKATADLMIQLYKRLYAKAPLAPCEALHQARRALLRTHPDPHHWAAFVFVGAP